MQIAGYLKTSLIEWSGKITSVIFTPGCSFRCPFCHNAELVDPQKVKKTPLLSQNEILEDLKSRKKWIDAVVITGGEPTLQKDLPDFLKEIKKLGFLTMIHTNGTSPETIHHLIDQKLIDFFCLDLKGDFLHYDQFTGVSSPLSKIKESLCLITKSGVEYEFRTTVVPGKHNLDNLQKLAGEIKKLAPQSSWYLQQFQPLNCLDRKMTKVEPFKKEELESFQKELQKIIPNVFLRGI